MRFPGGLFQPSLPVLGPVTPVELALPLVFLFIGAIASAIPVFEVQGIWMAALYTFVSFLVLCLLRWIIVHRAADPDGYISPSVWYSVAIFAPLFPAIFWIGVSWVAAYLMWGWELT